MDRYPESVVRLLTELQKLPGIGPKTAQRLAFFLLKRPAEEVRRLGEAILQLPESVVPCSRCGAITDKETDPCPICRDPRRDRSLLCVVEEPDDVAILERTGAYNGLYHVLGGVLSALNDVRPEDLRIAELLKRVEEGEVREIIFALSPSVEASATITYLSRLFAGRPVRLTQIAYGVPVGSDLDFVDDLTLTRALEGRHALH
ncbi:MAG: recombination protein RecR [Candidatus Poribacteria bacterium]|nr:MAG: recombination protein RecR [Candidatus Poribacteria bacterium]